MATTIGEELRTASELLREASDAADADGASERVDDAAPDENDTVGGESTRRSTTSMPFARRSKGSDAGGAVDPA